MENAFIESFNGRFRDEGLNAQLFFSVEDARRKIEAWRADYNDNRPHRSLGDRSSRDLLAGHQQEPEEARNLNIQVVQA